MHPVATAANSCWCNLDTLHGEWFRVQEVDSATLSGRRCLAPRASETLTLSLHKRREVGGIVDRSEIGVFNRLSEGESREKGRSKEQETRLHFGWDDIRIGSHYDCQGRVEKRVSLQHTDREKQMIV